MNTLQVILVCPKDIVQPENKCGVAYELSYEEFNATYIVLTERVIRKRFKEH